MENNIDPSTAQIFYVGSLSNMVSGQFTIQTTPANYFSYDPSQGNLLMDITNDGTNQSSQTIYPTSFPHRGDSSVRHTIPIRRRA